MLIESPSNFPDIFQFIAVGLGEMECAEARLPIAFPPSVTNDRAFERLARFNFQPGITSLSRKIDAIALFCDNAFQTQLFHGLDKGRPFIDSLADAKRRILFDRIFEPFAAP